MIIIIITMFVYNIADITHNQQYQHPPRRAALYGRVKHGQIAATHGAQRLMNRIGLTSWTFTICRDQHTSDKVAHYSIYRPRMNERLRWLSWLTYSGRLTHISGHLSAAGRAWDRKSSLIKDRRSTTVQRNLPSPLLHKWKPYLACES